MKYDHYWELFLQKELTFYDTKSRKYLKKGYLHFDNRIWFPEFKEAFKRFILSPEGVSHHSFLPFLKVIIETKRIKNNRVKHKRKLEIKPRPICYAAHFDALIYSFYSTYLTEKYEEYIKENGIGDCVLAYRSMNLCNIDFAKEVFDHIENKGPCIAICLDIKGFFDNLNHEILKRNWLTVINTNLPQKLEKLPIDQFKVYNSVSKFSYVNKPDLLKALSMRERDMLRLKLSRYCDIKDFREKVKGSSPTPLNVNTDIGIPQGSPISAVLSNIYMIDFDNAILALSRKLNFLYRRYCDDIIVVCDINMFEDVKASLYEEIEKLRLTIQPEKEEVVRFMLSEKGQLRGYKDIEKTKERNLQYLGFEFNGHHRYIRSSSVSRFYRRMKVGVRETVKRAYATNSKEGTVFKKNLYDRFTHLGGRNFLTYAYRAARIMNNSETIKKQLSRHFENLNKTLEQKTDKHLKRLARKGKIRIRKK